MATSVLESLFTKHPCPYNLINYGQQGKTDPESALLLTQTLYECRPNAVLLARPLKIPVQALACPILMNSQL